MAPKSSRPFSGAAARRADAVVRICGLNPLILPFLQYFCGLQPTSGTGLQASVFEPHGALLAPESAPDILVGDRVVFGRSKKFGGICIYGA